MDDTEPDSKTHINKTLHFRMSFRKRGEPGNEASKTYKILSSVMCKSRDQGNYIFTGHNEARLV